MMDFVEALTKKFEDQKQLMVNAMAAGSAKDYAEYQNMCGKIHGLNTALRELNDMLETAQKNEHEQ